MRARGALLFRRLRAVAAGYGRDTKAAAAVELALTLPFFLIFILVMMELAVYFFASSAVTQGVFDYSRRLIHATEKGKKKVHRDLIKTEILKFVGSPLIARIRYEIGPVTDKTDFAKSITNNGLKDFTADHSQPVYLRVLATRRTFTYQMFKPVWDVVTDKKNGGLFSDIDVLVVIPWPAEDQG